MERRLMSCQDGLGTTKNHREKATKTRRKLMFVSYQWLENGMVRPEKSKPRFSGR